MHVGEENKASEAVLAALRAADPDLVAALEARKPDSEVLPLIDKDAAKQITPWVSRPNPRTVHNFIGASTHARSHAPPGCVQDGRLPLHYAAAYTASEAVVAALLAEYPEAAREKTKVRLS